MPSPSCQSRVHDADIPAGRLMARIASELEQAARSTEALHALACAAGDLRDDQVRAAQAIDLNAQLLRDLARLMRAMAEQAPACWRGETRELGAAFRLEALKRRLLSGAHDAPAGTEAGGVEIF